MTLQDKIGRAMKSMGAEEVVLPEHKSKTKLAKAFKPKTHAPHLIVQALAGTGKTTTLVEGLKAIKGLPSPFTPSMQQKAIWDSMYESKDAKTICFVAFNKAIATELQARVPTGCEAMTMHSLGFRAVKARFGRVKVTGWRVKDIIADMLGGKYKELLRTFGEMMKATERLVSLCKMNLVGVHPHNPEGTYTPNDCYDEQGWAERLSALASHYDVEMNGSQRRVFELVPKVLERCKNVDSDHRIDFDDMIWLPIALGLQTNQYDLLLVDEAQDLNRCQQALAKKVGSRLILVGDKHQAIYGFAGADSESMDRLYEELRGDQWCSSSHTQQHIWRGPRKGIKEYGQVCKCCGVQKQDIKDQGCNTLPLTVTRRCGRAIVKEAQSHVPEFEAHETCSDGFVRNAPFSEKEERSYQQQVEDGDMVLCRVNAPLVSECFRFLKAGQKAQIQGRDVGAGLISTIKKQHATSIENLVGCLSDWYHLEEQKENKKSRPNEARLISLQDRYDCLVCFCEDQKTVEAVIARIEAVFTDDKDNKGITLSSIHKAKGLEAKRVFLLQPEGATMPHPMAKSAWQIEQEYNLFYVAKTRAIEELVYVS